MLKLCMQYTLHTTWKRLLLLSNMYVHILTISRPTFAWMWMSEVHSAQVAG